MKAEHRQFVRLKIANGLAVLRNSGVPSFACEILDLSESGCLCCASPKTVTHEVALSWAPLLVAGSKLEAEISYPPQIRNLVLNTEVTHADKLRSGEIHIGMRFQCDEAQRARLRDELLRIAAGKLHGTAFRLAAPAVRCVPAPAHMPKSEHVLTHESLLKASRLRDALLSFEAPAPQFEDQPQKSAQPLRESHINRLLLHDPSVTALDLCHALAIQTQLPVIDLDIADVRGTVKHLFSYLTMLRFQFVPFAESENLICIAAATPLNAATVKKLEEIVRRHVLVFLAPADKIHALQFKLRPNTRIQERTTTLARISAPVSYYFCDVRAMNLDGKVREGTTISMSESAAIIEGPEEILYVPEELANNGALLRICINPRTAPIRVTGRIIQIRFPQDAATWIYTLDFVQIGAEDTLKLQELYRTILSSRMMNRTQGAVPE